MKFIFASALMIMIGVSAYADNNSIAKKCLELYEYDVSKFDTVDWNKIAACASKARIANINMDLAELRDFLKHNPRYRVPGQSLNRCWGKPREMPFESSYIRVDPNGSMEAGVSYKDTLPTGCYENAPWDNRDEN